TSLNTRTVLQLMKIEQQFKDVKEVDEAIKLQDEMVSLLLSQLNEITEEWVAGLGQTQKSAIIQHYKTRMNEINSNPNSKSLPSQSQE
ncbi:hypothetical protein, partial [Neobacillus drentensis]|uniref:hypothetical protein n=1 Tax=Neobacillus drentensis TaxID=220684 RepID=UPI002FFEE65C